MGEGRRGNQEPLGGNLRLLRAHAEGIPFRVFLREGVGRWRDLGLYRVEGWRYALEEGRYVYWFTLGPYGSGGGP